MRHRLQKRHFNVDTKQRKALIKNLTRSLFECGEIVTTTNKAKEIKRVSDKLIAKSLKRDLTARRNLHRFFGNRDVVNTIVDKIVPPVANRVGGYTKITKLGNRRGDNADMSRLALVEKPSSIGLKKAKEIVKKENKQTKQSVKKTVTVSKPKKETKTQKVTEKKTVTKKAIAKKKSK